MEFIHGKHPIDACFVRVRRAELWRGGFSTGVVGGLLTIAAVMVVRTSEGAVRGARGGYTGHYVVPGEGVSGGVVVGVRGARGVIVRPAVGVGGTPRLGVVVGGGAG